MTSWIVLIEDNDDDAKFMAAAFEARLPGTRVDRFGEGAEAQRSLMEIASSTGQTPDLIMLDLNLPDVSGFDFLEWLRGSPELMATPTLVLSTSRARRDVVKSYRMRANAFIQKPDDITGFQPLADDVVQFWINRATLCTSL